jgi:hypothetical protein
MFTFCLSYLMIGLVQWCIRLLCMRLQVRLPYNTNICVHEHARYIESEGILCIISFSYPYPTKWGWYNIFFHLVIKIRQLFLRPAAFLTSTLFETRLGANDCKCSQDISLTKHGGARNNKFGHPSDG